MKKLTFTITSFLAGMTNGILGTGGGIPAVIAFKRCRLTQKEAQATSLAATLSLSIISAINYLYYDFFNLTDAMIYLPFGVPGALIGSYLLRRVPDKALKKLFSVFIFIAGIRMTFK